MKAYFDTSAIVKLLIAEPDSATAVQIWTAARERVASQLIYPEARAALAAATRAKRISTNELRRAVSNLDATVAAMVLIGVDQPLTRSAGALAETHRLRGYDAVHLATLLSVSDPNVVLVSWDRDLATAAQTSGHPVAPAI